MTLSRQIQILKPGKTGLKRDPRVMTLNDPNAFLRARNFRGGGASGASGAGLVGGSLTSASTAAATSLGVPVPLSFSSGDLLVSAMFFNDNANNSPGLNTPSGWTLVVPAAVSTILIPAGCGCAFFSKVSDGTETGTTPFTWTANGAMIGYSFALKGIDTTAADSAGIAHNDYDNWPGELPAHSGAPVAGGVAVFSVNLLSQNAAQGVPVTVPDNYNVLVSGRFTDHANANGHGAHQLGYVDNLSVAQASAAAPFTHSGMVASGGVSAGHVVYFDPS
jgi:hypothetical protein